MNEVVSVGFDKVRLCLFVFITVMLSFPLWLITIPLAPWQRPSREIIGSGIRYSAFYSPALLHR